MAYDVYKSAREIADMLAAATPRPWTVERDPDRLDSNRVEGIRGPAPAGDKWNEDARGWSGPGRSEYVDIVICDSGVYPPRLADANLIVALRNAAPEILDELELIRMIETNHPVLLAFYRKAIAAERASRSRTT